MVRSVDTLSASWRVMSSTEWFSNSIRAASMIVGVGAYGLISQLSITSSLRSAPACSSTLAISSCRCSSPVIIGL